MDRFIKIVNKLQKTAFRIFKMASGFLQSVQTFLIKRQRKVKLCLTYTHTHIFFSILVSKHSECSKTSRKHKMRKSNFLAKTNFCFRKLKNKQEILKCMFFKMIQNKIMHERIVYLQLS